MFKILLDASEHGGLKLRTIDTPDQEREAHDDFRPMNLHRDSSPGKRGDTI